ncbi:MAG: hypothetical protein JNM66_15650 [Bryobacterales bacterium]|nr:hypothetical protein [Bryobacterales bacterium]
MLDTRTKIVSPDQVAGRTIVAAYFDPMVATHTQRYRELANIHGPLAICICDPPGALLPAQARAELAASLRSVELVVIGEAALARAAAIIDERPADLDRRQALIHHVHSRQNG